ncbi:MAG: hypothetical protein ACMUHB_01310 [Thermoplasmatota archaeon]
MRRLKNDMNGGMEGIPLQLIIAVVIGMAALGVLVGWLALAGDADPTLRSVETDPETIEIEGDGRVNETLQVTVYVYDSEGSEVDGVVVTISGSVDDPVVRKIDSGDDVEIVAVLPSGSSTALININAEKGGGMGSCETTMIVMRT